MNVMKISHAEENSYLIPDKPNDFQNWKEFVDNLVAEIGKSGSAIIEVRTLAGIQNRLAKDYTSLCACRFWVSNEQQYVDNAINATEMEVKARQAEDAKTKIKLDASIKSDMGS